jgi:hypothetical protein
MEKEVKATEEITISKPQLLFLVFGLLISLGLAWHQFLLFLRAYISPQKAVALYIDVYGEANSELILLTISIIISTITTGYILWFLRGLNKRECYIRNEK